jgi:uncharacterized membrane protein
MVNVDRSVIINRPLDDVWAVINDPSQMPKWRKALKSVEILTDAPYGVGSRGRDTERMMGRNQVSVWEVTEHEEKKRVSMRGIEGSVDFQASMALEEAEGGTKYSIHLSLGFKGIMALFSPLMAPMIRAR